VSNVVTRFNRKVCIVRDLKWARRETSYWFGYAVSISQYHGLLAPSFSFFFLQLWNPSTIMPIKLVSTWSRWHWTLRVPCCLSCLWPCIFIPNLSKRKLLWSSCPSSSLCLYHPWDGWDLIHTRTCRAICRIHEKRIETICWICTQRMVVVVPQ